jgi:type III secretion inner rod protein HrpB2
MDFATTQQLLFEIARGSGGAGDAADPSSPSQQLVDKFQALMAQGGQPAQQVHPAQQDVLTKAVQEQDDYARMVPNDLQYVTQHLSAMSMQRIAAVTMQMNLEVANLGADMDAKMAAVQSSKDAIQTLMKNQ